MIDIQPTSIAKAIREACHERNLIIEDFKCFAPVESISRNVAMDLEVAGIDVVDVTLNKAKANATTFTIISKGRQGGMGQEIPFQLDS